MLLEQISEDKWQIIKADSLICYNCVETEDDILKKHTVTFDVENWDDTELHNKETAVKTDTFETVREQKAVPQINDSTDESHEQSHSQTIEKQKDEPPKVPIFALPDQSKKEEKVMYLCNLSLEVFI